MRVLKFGGTSIADGDCIRQVISLINERPRAGPMPPAGRTDQGEEELLQPGSREAGMVVVLSAMGSTTDQLEKIGDLAAAGRGEDSIKAVEALRQYHLEIIKSLFEGEAQTVGITACCEKVLADLKTMVSSVAVLADLSPTVRARLLSVGERLSTHIVCTALGVQGVAAEWIDARTLIVTDDQPIQAEPLLDETYQQCRERLAPVLEAGRIVVTQGFVGRSAAGCDTVLGRGGSDYSAALIGAAMDASEIEIWTDVDGVMTADPSLVPEARRIPVMSFQEAAELAFFGARVLHPKTLAPAVERSIPVRVLNTKRPAGRGTVILAEPVGNGSPVKSIAYKEGMSLVNLVSTRMFQARGFLKKIFALFERYEISPDVVATSEVAVAVAVWDVSKLPKVVEKLRDYGSVTVKPHQAVVCVVGERLKQTAGIVGRVFEELGDVKTSLVSVGGSEINLSFVIDEEELPRVITRLHRRFFGQEESQ